MIRDECAISTTLNYVLSLSLATLLITGLLVAGGNFVKDQREQTIRTELQVVGQQAVSSVAAADRLAQTAGMNGDVVEITQSLPDRVTGMRYSINVNDGSDPYLILSTNQPDISVRVDIVPLANPLVTSSIQGGKIRVVYDVANDELEVEHV